MVNVILLIIAPNLALSKLILSIALSRISSALTAFSLVFSFTVLNFCKEAEPGDVENTSADTHSLEDWINFKPNTSIEKGVKEFVSWYKSFYG